MTSRLLLLAVVAYGALALQQTRVERVPSKIELMLANGTYAKYYAEKQAERKRLGLSDDVSEPVSDIYNTFYLAHVDVGTPAQTFIVVFDTGSSDFWLTDSSYVGGDAPEKFNSKASSTYKNLGGHWVIHYGSGEAAGFKGQDKVCMTGTNYCFDSQIFGQATQEGVQAQQPIDGILGLAYQSISSIGTPNPWLNMADHSSPAPPNDFFTFWLEDLSGTPPPPSGKKGGAITWGDHDTEHCSSDCTWVPLSKELWYYFDIDGVGAGSYKGRASHAISDTGTSFLIGPSSDISRIAEEIGGTLNGQGLYSIDCSKKTNGVPIDVHINGKNYPISAKNYIISFDGGNSCVVAMQGANLGDPEWILGDTFIREWCQSYDLKGKRVGLCKAN